MDILTMFYTIGTIFFFIGSILLVFLMIVAVFMARSIYRVEKQVTEKITSLESGIKYFQSNFVGSFFSGMAFIAKILKNR